MRLVSLTGADEVAHPVHGSATAGPDGVFDLPDAFGRFLLAAKAQWCTEADKLARDARAALRELSDPKKAQQVLANVQARVVELEATVAELLDRLEGKTAPKPKPIPAPSPAPVSLAKSGDGAPAAPEPKKAAAKKAPARKAAPKH